MILLVIIAQIYLSRKTEGFPPLVKNLPVDAGNIRDVV